MDETQHAALAYHTAGLVVIPTRCDGSKSPAFRWRQYQESPPGRHHIEHWFDPQFTDRGIAVLTGLVSGNLELIDFDSGELFGDWIKLVEAKSPGLFAKLCVVRTPRSPSGFHVWYRCTAVKIPGNKKLAADAKKTLIETRGQGGYAILPGSPLATHASGKPYQHVDGPPLTAIADITEQERAILIDAARSFDKSGQAEKDKQREARLTARQSSDHGAALAGATLGTRPGDDFNARGPSWSEILAPHGWTLDHSTGSIDHWVRPGKTTEGTSATTGYARGGAGDPLLYVFSSNAAPFENEETYSKFSAYALLNFAGNYAEAARDLARRGYGKEEIYNGPDASLPTSDKVTKLWTGAAPEPTPAPNDVPTSLPPEIDRWYLDTPHTPPSDPTPTQVIACENPYGVHLEHLRDGRWRYIWKDCQRPSCRGCAPRWKALRQKMLVREAMEFERHNPSQPWFVFTAEDGTNWQTISAYISRRRGQFARCNRNGEGYLSCVATVHPGPSAKDVREMRPMDAAKLLGGHIQGMPLIDKKHAFTTSRGWVIEEKIKKWQSQWRRISKISTSIHRVISILRHREADLKNVFSPENQTWTWHGVELHPITLNADPEHVANEVSCGEVLPEFEADLPWGDGLEYSTGPPGSAGASLLAW